MKKLIKLFSIATMVAAGAAIFSGLKNKENYAVYGLTKTEDASKITIHDQVGWCFRTLHMYNVSYATDYSTTEFVNFLNGFYGNKIENNFDKQTATRSWAYNNNTVGDYFIAAGGDTKTYEFVFPWWVNSATVQVLNSSNWADATDGFKFHKESNIYMYAEDKSGYGVSVTEGNSYTYSFDSVTVSKKAISDINKSEFDVDLGTDSTVIYNKYPNGLATPANPTANITGYSFAGWYMDAQLTTPFEKKIISSDTIIYAKYIKASGRYIVGSFPESDDWTVNTGVLMSKTGNENIGEVTLAYGDELRIPYYNGSSLQYSDNLDGYSAITPNAAAYYCFGKNGNNIKCFAAGTYRFYFIDDANYDTNYKISVELVGDLTAQHLAAKLMSYESINNTCKNNDRYPTVKAMYNSLNADEQTNFQSYVSSSEEQFKNAYDRFVAWANANGEVPFTFAKKSTMNIRFTSLFDGIAEGNTSSIVVAILTLVAAAGCVGFLVYRKRKEN